MLERARRRCEDAGWANVTLLQDDAAELARWREGLTLLRERLQDVDEAPYLSGAGMLVSGIRR